MPPLALAGRVPSNNATMMLDTAALGLVDGFSDWPQFSNGVAAGLRVSPGQAHLTRTWIVYNKPASPTPAHAGFLMALGMQGHLASLGMSDLFEYLSQVCVSNNSV